MWLAFLAIQYSLVSLKEIAHGNYGFSLETLHKGFMHEVAGFMCTVETSFVVGSLLRLFQFDRLKSHQQRAQSTDFVTQGKSYYLR